MVATQVMLSWVRRMARGAGLVWVVGTDSLKEILPPDAERWGVYAISFTHLTRTVDDLVSAFRLVLPQLKAKYAEVRHAV